MGDGTPVRFRCPSVEDGHFAAGAVEAQGEAAAVVDEEERAGGGCSLMDGAEAELVFYAVFRPHEFGILAMGKLEGLFHGTGTSRQVCLSGNMVGNI